MPTYDYFCEDNGRTLEVRHPMGQIIKNWSQLCKLAGSDPGKTPGKASVTKLLNGGHPVRSSSGPGHCGADAPCAIDPSACCGGGACGLN